MFFEDLSKASKVRYLGRSFAVALFALAAGPVLSGSEALPGMQPVFAPPVFVPPVSSLVEGGQVGTTVAQSRGVAAAINDASVFCKRVPGAYQASCMADQLATIAESLPPSPANDEIRAVLGDASHKIEKVAQDNRDRSQPRISAKSPDPNPVSTSSPLVAVKPEAEAATIEQTAAILDEAGSLLLRSAASSQEHAEQYLLVAEALDNSALLLRS